MPTDHALTDGGEGLTYGSVCSGIEAKICAACGEEKPLAAFHRQGRRGHHSYCKGCYNARYRGERRRAVSPDAKRAHNIRSRYGLSLEAVAEMKAAQGGVCAICSAILTRFRIDHDHETGRVRGLLCHPCNVALPAVENSDYLRAALRYLGRRD